MAGQILVLEDDPDQSLLMCDVLLSDGHACLTAASVDEAERILDEAHVDLAILDMNLPGRSGLEALQHIRAVPATHDIPVIVLTANHQFQRQAEQLGTDLFLVKPLNLNELRTLVIRYLSR
jgi:two-component system OmpR family response regulator